MVRALLCLWLVACDAGDVVEGRTPQCPTPFAAVPSVIMPGTAIVFSGESVEIGTSDDPTVLPNDWDPNDTFVAPADRPHVVLFAREAGASDACTFRATLRIIATFPTDDAVAADAEVISAWAERVADEAWGTDNDPDSEDASRALGPATTDPYDTASLGNGGALTLRFDPPIHDGDGADIAIFENGFTDQFLELAYVEVSSDGDTFVRFPTLALDMEPVSAYGTLDASRVIGVAGRYRIGFGTPFDLAELRNDPDVRAAYVDLEAITHVRVVDIIGDGSAKDSFGNPIYDPTPTFGTAGFDLEAIAVLN